MKSFIFHRKTEDVCKDFANDFKDRFYTSNYSKDNDRPLAPG